MKRFQKRVEHFICSNCGFKVRGNGFTNHCPACLWSKHVDEFPGDRKQACEGMMRPVELDTKGETIFVIHACLECGERKRNKTSPFDHEAVLRFSAAIAEARSKKNTPE